MNSKTAEMTTEPGAEGIGDAVIDHTAFEPYFIRTRRGKVHLLPRFFAAVITDRAPSPVCVAPIHPFSD